MVRVSQQIPNGWKKESNKNCVSQRSDDDDDDEYLFVICS